MSIEAFLSAHGFGAAARHPLPGDASFRRYERLAGGPRPALLMVCPAGKEAIAPFARVARHLAGIGLSAPAIIAEDDAAGLALVEDLGEATFTRLLAAGEDETALTLLAVDALAVLHRSPAPAWAPRWGAEEMAHAAAATLIAWWWPASVGAPAPLAVAEAFLDAARATIAPFAADAPVLVLRDFHVDNLMLLPDRAGIAACGLLDFQDAVIGPVTYDLMSLLEDARRDIDPALVAAMTDRYLAAFPALDRAGFAASMAVLGAQRHAKVIGIFTRLCRRDGKPQYLRHIPRVWRLFERSLSHPALAPVKAWVDSHIPPARRTVPQ